MLIETQKKNSGILKGNKLKKICLKWTFYLEFGGYLQLFWLRERSMTKHGVTVAHNHSVFEVTAN